MGAEYITYIEVDPMPNIPGTIGSGATLPVVIEVTAPGTTLLSAHGIPADKDITLELWGGGGGGASDDGSLTGGGGGGGGGYLCLEIPAALVTLDGNLVIGAAGTGGVTPDHDGTDGGDSSITLDSVLRGKAGKGLKGLFTGGVGGAGGTNTVGAGVVATVTRSGAAGGTADGDVPGAGGVPGVGGAGGGGAGGDGAGENGFAGTAGRARITYAI